jgi:Protein of unknown function (DUF2817)
MIKYVMAKEIMENKNKTFEQCQQEFLGLSGKKKLLQASWEIGASSPEGEALKTHFAFTQRNLETVFVHICGVHGSEGYFGHEVQMQLLHQDLVEKTVNNFDLAFIHPLNPFGMSWCTRTNNQNVDLTFE